VNGAVSEEAWQVFISILQAVRDEPFEDLSLFAQNPLGGRDCIHRILYDDGRKQAKRLSVLLDHRALEEQVTSSNMPAAVPADVNRVVSTQRHT
jgi:hypothetical protein